MAQQESGTGHATEPEQRENDLIGLHVAVTERRRHLQDRAEQIEWRPCHAQLALGLHGLRPLPGRLEALEHDIEHVAVGGNPATGLIRQPVGKRTFVVRAASHTEILSTRPDAIPGLSPPTGQHGRCG